jgi:hypothetical protein
VKAKAMGYNKRKAIMGTEMPKVSIPYGWGYEYKT